MRVTQDGIKYTPLRPLEACRMTPPHPLKPAPVDVADATLAEEAQSIVDRLVSLVEEEAAHDEEGLDGKREDEVQCAVSEVLLEMCEALESRG